MSERKTTAAAELFMYSCRCQTLVAIVHGRFERQYRRIAGDQSPSHSSTRKGMGSRLSAGDAASRDLFAPCPGKSRAKNARNPPSVTMTLTRQRQAVKTPTVSPWQAAEKLHGNGLCNQGTASAGPQPQSNECWALAPANHAFQIRLLFGPFPQPSRGSPKTCQAHILRNPF